MDGKRAIKSPLIALPEDGGAVIVRGGVRIEFNRDGGIDVYGPVPVMLHAPMNDTPAAIEKPRNEPQVGDKMPDGTIFAGMSLDTNKPLYTTPADATLSYRFNEARKYAAHLDAHRHRDWRVPTKSELNLLFQNRAAIGGFNERGSLPAAWYWSSTDATSDYAWTQRFSDGNQSWVSKYNASSLRCVRG